MRKYKIGDVARLLGSTTQTLRFYEQAGVIKPEKSENGTRYYTESDIIRLMAFKRFQLIDFSVQDVAEHFMHGSLDTLLPRMEETIARLKQESAELLRRAQSIEQFEQMLRIAKEGVGGMKSMMRPDLYMHACTLAELDRLTDGQRETFERFMNAMPEAHICFLYHPGQRKPLDFRFAITQRHARDWQMALENTLRLPGGPCVRLLVRTDDRLWDAAYLDEQIARVRAAGYTVDETLPVIGQQYRKMSESRAA